MDDNKNIIPKGHLNKSILFEMSNLKNKETSLDYFKNSIKSLPRNKNKTFSWHEHHIQNCLTRPHINKHLTINFLSLVILFLRGQSI